MSGTGDGDSSSETPSELLGGSSDALDSNALEEDETDAEMAEGTVAGEPTDPA